MTQVATPSDYKKDYLPGYTGHVPSKTERFGSTAGQIKREILTDFGKHPVTLTKYNSINDANRLYSKSFTPQVDKNKLIYSNSSRYAKNWICGPNHEIRHQQIPGYTGHIKGLVSENLYANSFGHTTAKAIGKKHPIGYDLPVAKQRFISQNSSQYVAKNFRRFIDRPLMQPRKDYDDYTSFVNDSFQDQKQSMLKMINDKTGITERSPYNTGASNNFGIMQNLKSGPRFKQVRNRQQTTIDEGGDGSFVGYEVQPNILESKVSASKDFAHLSDGFKRCFSQDRKDRNLIIPISGYGGHRRGDRSQNFFGKGFRETSLQSKKLERRLKTQLN